MEEGVYSMVETQWDISDPSFVKYKKSTIKNRDEYTQVEFGSNIEEQFENNWKPGGTLVGVSDRWGSKVESKGSDKMGQQS